MVDKFTVLLSIHILTAAFWVGGALALNVAMTLAGRHADPAMRLAAFRFAKVLGPKVFLPMALIVLGTGIWLTSDYFDFGDLWIVLGLIGLVTAVTIGLGYLNPGAGRALAAIESGAGPPPPGKRNWAPFVGMFNLLLISAVLVIMVIRPT